MLMTAAALPDIERRSPVTIAADPPILHVFQPVTETAFANGRRDPVHRIVIGDEFIPHRRHTDKPRLPGIVNKGCIAAPAMGIAMLKYRCFKKFAGIFQILQDQGIGILDEDPRPVRIRCHLSLAVYKLNKRHIILLADPVVVLTEGRCRMNDTGAILRGNVVITDDKKSFLVDFPYRVGIERFIVPVLQIPPLKSSQNLTFSVDAFKDGIDQSGR